MRFPGVKTPVHHLQRAISLNVVLGAGVDQAFFKPVVDAGNLIPSPGVLGDIKARYRPDVCGHGHRTACHSNP